MKEIKFYYGDFSKSRTLFIVLTSAWAAVTLVLADMSLRGELSPLPAVAVTTALWLLAVAVLPARTDKRQVFEGRALVGEKGVEFRLKMQTRRFSYEELYGLELQPVKRIGGRGVKGHRLLLSGTGKPWVLDSRGDIRDSDATKTGLQELYAALRATLDDYHAEQ